jgi:hypothetical protein
MWLACGNPFGIADAAPGIKATLPKAASPIAASLIFIEISLVEV